MVRLRVVVLIVIALAVALGSAIAIRALTPLECRTTSHLVVIQ